MQRTLILECNSKIGEKVTVAGFVVVRRDHGKIIFLDVIDRSGIIQIVLTNESHLGGVTLLSDIHPQDVVEIIGKVTERPEKLINPNIPTGKIELQSKEIKVLSKAAELPFDLAMKELDLQLPTLLDFRSLTLRHPKVKAIFKVQAEILKAFREIAQKLDAIEIIVPTIVASSTEGGAEVFRVDYYQHKAFMSQSPQLYKQMLVPVFERVSTIAKAYRAEPSVTTRHLSESTQLDFEFGFCKFNDLLDLLEEVGTYILETVSKRFQKELKEFGVKDIAFGKIPRLTLMETQEIIFKEFGRDNRKEKDLTPQDEVDICKWAREKHRSDLITITHFPTAAKPFYTMPDPEDPKYSLSYDLLFRGVEILSGSQRINDYKQLLDSIKGRGMDPKGFEMYLQAFKYGMPPEGGFSFGLERLTYLLLKLGNIREASLFPRDMERVDVRLSTLKQ